MVDDDYSVSVMIQGRSSDVSHRGGVSVCEPLLLSLLLLRRLRPVVEWYTPCAMATRSPFTASPGFQMDYETKILPRTGGYGRYNRLVVVFSWFPTFAVMLNLISDVFYTRIPDSYHCKPDPQLLPSTFLLSNLTRQVYLSLTIPWVNGTGFSHCELFKYPPNSSDFSGNGKERVPCTKGWEYAHEAGLQSNFVTEVRVITPG